MNRKKIIIYILISLLLIVLMIGCTKSVEIEEVEEDTGNLEQEYLQDFDNSNSNVDEDLNNSNQIQDNLSNSDNTNSNNEQVASIIVKSENNLSDSQKQEIIDELSKEVDELLEEINNFE